MQLRIPVVAMTLTLGTALIVPRPAVAQLAFPTAGARVRVTAPDFSLRDTGRLVHATPDSLTMRFATTTPDMTIAVDKLSRLEVSIGKNRGAGLARGAGFGTLIGMAWGAGLGAFMQIICHGTYCPHAFLITVPNGAGVGLILGTIRGVAYPPDQWQQVSLTRRTGGPTWRGAVPVGLRLSL